MLAASRHVAALHVLCGPSARVLTTRPLPQHLPIRPTLIRYSATTTDLVVSDHLPMFARSVKKYEQSAPPPKASAAKSDFASSSPTISDAFRVPSGVRKPATTEMARTAHSPSVLRSTSPSALNGPAKSLTGHKWTASQARGLENTLNKPDSFSESKSAITMGENPSKTTQNAEVYFEENDFDDDIDLDDESPNLSRSIPRGITSIEPPLPPAFDPRIAVRQATGPPVPLSSGQATWSSSPLEHKQPPAARLTSQKHELLQSSADSDPPTKRNRRTLPWSHRSSQTASLEPSVSFPRPNASGSLETKDLQEVSSISHATHSGLPRGNPLRQVHNSDDTPQPRNSKSRVGTGVRSDFTPLPKDNTKSAYPWNTTASAVKEEQKRLRQTNKLKFKPIAPPAEYHSEALSGRKTRVPAMFLSEEQRHVLDLVVNKGKSVFFTGSAGTGKSVLMRELIVELRKKYFKEPDRVAVTASTGLAACNVGGVTLHSFSGIGLGKENAQELVRKIKKQQKSKMRWLRTKVLIIDEISMVDGELFDKLEEIARTIRTNGRPFGGIQIIITGDFFQLPPVPDRGKISRFAFEASTWNTSIEHTIGLTQVFRQRDPTFANLLNEMRLGRISPECLQTFKKLERPLTFDDGLDATELFSTRGEVDYSNNIKMKVLPGQERVFDARDSGTVTDKMARDRLLSNCMAPASITLKEGAQVMLIKNMDDTLVNGSLGKVIGFMNENTYDLYKDHEGEVDAGDSVESDEDDKHIKARKKLKGMLKDQVATTGRVWPLVRFQIANGTSRDMLVQHEDWKIELPNGEIQAARSQIPLILAWALSIHKAQGQTLERVKVDLGKVFEKGQAYVALSRATCQEGLQVLRFNPQKVMAHEKVRGFYNSLYNVELAAKKKAAPAPVQDLEDEDADAMEALYGR